MIDKLFLSIIITLLLGVLFNINGFKVAPLRSLSGIQQSNVQAA